MVPVPWVQDQLRIVTVSLPRSTMSDQRFRFVGMDIWRWSYNVLPSCVDNRTDIGRSDVAAIIRDRRATTFAIPTGEESTSCQPGTPILAQRGLGV